MQALLLDSCVVISPFGQVLSEDARASTTTRQSCLHPFLETWMTIWLSTRRQTSTWVDQFRPMWLSSWAIYHHLVCCLYLWFLYLVRRVLFLSALFWVYNPCTLVPMYSCFINFLLMERGGKSLPTLQKKYRNNVIIHGHKQVSWTNIRHWGHCLCKKRNKHMLLSSNNG